MAKEIKDGREKEPLEENETVKLLQSWGFEPDAIQSTLEQLQSSDRPQNTVIDIGTTALDCKRKGKFDDDPFMGGLALIGPDNKVINAGVIFETPPPELLQTAHAGGIGNAANAIASVLKATIEADGLSETQFKHKSWAIMAWLGSDDVGQAWAEIINPDIDKSLLQVHPTIPYSGLSDIRIQSEEYATDIVPSGDRAIYFRAGASGATEFTNKHLLAVLIRQPFNVSISYPGLFPDGADKSNGQNLAWFIREAQKVCPCVGMDIHGFTTLLHIEPALPDIDMFNSNFADAARVFIGKTVAEHITDNEKLQLYQEMAAVICRKYVKSEIAAKDRYRMFTITDKKGTFLVFQDPRSSQIVAEYLPSPCTAIPARDKTGAGDVRFALQRLYIAMRLKDEWRMGKVKLDQVQTAVNIGQIGTALHLQGKEAQALKGVSISALEKLAKSGNEFPDLDSLKRALA